MKEIPMGRRFVWSLFILVLAGVVAAAVWIRLMPKPGIDRVPLPDYGSIPDFSLIERSGRTLTRSDLLGKVWIADFVFTSCAGPCPLMTMQMAKLQTDLSRKSDVRLVSFTVDPERDTPEVLSRYADQYGAKRDRWLFLTGEKKTIYCLATESFHLTVKENAPEESANDAGPILHSTRFVLVDRQGRIRGYYNGTDADVLQRLLPDVGTLLRQEKDGASIYDLPAVNATLNGTSALLLMLGYVFIRRRNVTAHKICMGSAFATSMLFLISYLTYHYHVGSVRFPGQGWVRPVYFAILISHTILAALIVPLALTTLYRAWREQFNKHMRIARWTLPVWMYVSVTGVIVYWMLYQLYTPR